MNEYTPLLGILNQYLRSWTGWANGAVRDVACTVLMIAAVVGAQWLSGADLVGREAWSVMLEHFLMVLGITQATSSAANIAVGLGAPASHAAIPVTNNPK